MNTTINTLENAMKWLRWEAEWERLNPSVPQSASIVLAEIQRLEDIIADMSDREVDAALAAEERTDESI